jgi:hypothetical protein
MQLDYIVQGAVALLAVVLGRAWLRTWQQHNTKQRLGCKRPKRFGHRLPGGIDLFRKRIARVKTGRYNQVFQDHFARY